MNIKNGKLILSRIETWNILLSVWSPSISPKKTEKMLSNSPKQKFFKFGYLPHSFHRQCELKSLRTITFLGTTYIH